MTAIQYGGGPTLEQRRVFAGLKEGSHVPGYKGYCPQLKYRQGKTYGQDTHELSKIVIHLEPKTLDDNCYSHETEYRKLPQATGDNKYTEQMVPGYTGYVPKMIFSFGGTYRQLTDNCVDSFIRDYGKTDAKMADVHSASVSLPKLHAISGDPSVKNHLNFWANGHQRQPILMDDKRSSTEPPIPGYKGFVPRIYTTDLGLGCRYHDMTKKGLDSFYQDIQRSALTSRMALTPHMITTPQVTRSMTCSAPIQPSSGRLYMKDGMIPKYTGYVPRERFHFGNTYGDTTRSMPVCKHNEASFGEYVRTLH